ncbi:MAG: class I SAM-dependent methyltransferase [Gammaproteobacteria bacterium]|nr:class I SAM-dependent methyltransferase [Gammaproteobacteria bacterium]NVK88919.1 class I SAM-dependent methyltransferase [Gammaproteobacteria bacterium]
MKKYLALVVFAVVATTMSTANANDAISAAVNSDLRDAKAKARDAFRHPVETLQFFGVEPNMTVVEVSPGGGWYSEILAPLLKDKGQLIAAHFDPESEVAYYQKALKKYQDKFFSDPDQYGNIRLSVFLPPNKLEIAPANSADRVLTFRNVHNWYFGSGQEGTEKAFASFYRALKPGGILGVVEHRLPESASSQAMEKSGYMKQSLVIEMAEKAGFKLVAKSEINANPKDTADHPKGVWTLPPSLRLGDQDRDKYLAIGESDRMTLKFIKPLEK